MKSIHWMLPKIPGRFLKGGDVVVSVRKFIMVYGALLSLASSILLRMH